MQKLYRKTFDSKQAVWGRVPLKASLFIQQLRKHNNYIVSLRTLSTSDRFVGRLQFSKIELQTAGST